MPTEFEAGQIVLREGEPASGFYLIESGTVVLEGKTEDGKTVVIDTVSAGEPLGWSWLFPPYLWSFDARATEPCTAICLSGLLLRQHRDDDLTLSHELHKRASEVMVRRLQAAQKQTDRAQITDVAGVTDERKRTRFHHRHRGGIPDRRSGNARAAFAHSGDSGAGQNDPEGTGQARDAPIGRRAGHGNLPRCRRCARGKSCSFARNLATLAARDGLQIASAGTHPFSHWMDQLITPRTSAMQRLSIRHGTRNLRRARTASQRKARRGGQKIKRAWFDQLGTGLPRSGMPIWTCKTEDRRLARAICCFQVVLQFVA